MTSRHKIRTALARIAAMLAFAALVSPFTHAAEHITLRNGFELDCARRETTGDRVRLYLVSASATDTANYIEVSTAAIVRSESIADSLLGASGSTVLSSTAGLPASSTVSGQASAAQPSLTPAEMREMLVCAGTLHHIDADLLASVVHAESNGNARAVSRAGARGLMQLMPGTATDFGVQDSFAPEQNIGGGTAYLDALLIRYHDNIAFALAAYNAGPAAVERYHGIPPYAETRAYVARIVREFNRRKLAGAAVTPAVPSQLAAK